MKKWLAGLAVLVMLATSWPADAKVEVREGKFWFNGVRQEMVWGRSCFKLANQVSYHYKGQGGNHWGLHSARAFVDLHMEELGVPEGFVCRVFLETAAWSPCESGAEANDGKPDNCMFGSEPRDLGFWNGSDWNEDKQQTNRDHLRDGHRQTKLDAAGEKIIEWFYQTSQETGMAFELIFNATTKHDNIPTSEIDHINRQIGVFMGEKMEAKYPRALIIPNLMNEWNAHSRVTLHEVNMWAVRWHRDNYFPHSDAPIMVDGGGSNEAPYEIGPEDGNYRSLQIHPDRGAGWDTFPQPADVRRLRTDARGMPIGANESMYYVSANGRNGTVNTLSWYRPGGRTAAWELYEGFLNWQLDSNAVRDGYDYFIIHDDKGAQSQRCWPRCMTEVDQWIQTNLGNGGGSVEPPPAPTPTLEYEHLINSAYLHILLREADPAGLLDYNNYLKACFAQEQDWGVEYHCLSIMNEALVRSDEYLERFIEQ